ncbi:hypothetical protein D3C76_1065400 [compost metagenome]
MQDLRGSALPNPWRIERTVCPRSSDSVQVAIRITLSKHIAAPALDLDILHSRATHALNHEGAKRCAANRAVRHERHQIEQVAFGVPASEYAKWITAIHAHSGVLIWG